MSKYDTVIFDLDGTLLNTLDDLCDSTNFALTEHGYPQRTLFEIRSFVGNGIGMLIARALPNGKDNEDYEKVFATFKDHYSKNCNNKTCLYDGIDELIRSLENNGYKLAVVSNKVDSAVKALCEKYFSDTIGVAIGETDKVRRKPAPDEVFEALTILGSQKTSTVYIGDSEVDIETASNAGIDCISVSWGFRDEDLLREAGASVIIDTPKRVFEYISKK